MERSYNCVYTAYCKHSMKDNEIPLNSPFYGVKCLLIASNATLDYNVVVIKVSEFINHRALPPFWLDSQLWGQSPTLW